MVAAPAAAQNAPEYLPHPPGNGFYCTTWDATWQAHGAYVRSERDGQRMRDRLVEQGTCARLRDSDRLTDVRTVPVTQEARAGGPVALVFELTLEPDRVVYYLLLPPSR